MPYTYQNLVKFMEISQSSDRNKNAQFFETRFSFNSVHGEA